MVKQPRVVTLRPARLEDCRSLWEWRNNPETREASFHTQEIPFEDHRAWFESRIGSPDLKILIVLNPEGTEIGYVRFQFTGPDAEVSVALDAAQRGKGYGPAAVRAASDQLLAQGGGVKRVVALIKHSNPASKTVFDRAGFKVSGDRWVKTEKVWEMVYDAALAR